MGIKGNNVLDGLPSNDGGKSFLIIYAMHLFISACHDPCFKYGLCRWQRARLEFVDPTHSDGPNTMREWDKILGVVFDDRIKFGSHSL